MLKTNEYHGNAYMKHIQISKLIEIKEKHFIRWLNLFQQEAVKHLPKDKAKEITEKATLIAKSLSYGMIGNNLDLNN